MSQEKTHEATPKKIEDARKKGQVALSQVPYLASSVILLTLFLPLIGQRMWLNSSGLLECGFAAGVEVLTQCDDVLNSMVQELIIGPILLTAFLHLLIGLLQTRFNLSFQSISIDFDKLNPMRGFSNIGKSLKWFAFDIFKFGFVAVVIVSLLLVALYVVGGWFLLPASSAAQLAAETMRLLMAGIAIALLPLLVADIVVQRYKHMRELRMTYQEVREEYKNSEGDPHIRARRQALHQTLSREAMTQRIKKATVILVAREGQ